MTERPNLYDEFSYQGLWWFPNTPEEKWGGTVFFNPKKRIILSLTAPKDDYYRIFDQQTDVQIIQGEVIDLKKHITLVYCRLNGRDIGDEVAIIRYDSELLLCGCLYNSVDEMVFESVAIDYSSLKGWMYTNPPFKDDSQLYDNMQKVSYTRPENVKIPVHSVDADLYLDTYFTKSKSLHKFSWIQWNSIRVEPQSPQSINWFFEKITSLRNLLALLAGIPVERKRIQALSKGLDENDTLAVDIFHSVSLPQSDHDANTVMPLALEHLGEHVGDVFQTWFEKQERIHALSDLSLGVLYNAHQFWKFEFLALIQAVESYHQIINPTFKKSGPHASELKERLETLYAGLPSHLQVFIGLQGSFLKSVVDTRNYYTHYNPKKRKNALQGSELYDAIIRLIRFVVILMYTELGIPDQEIREAINRTHGYGLWWRSDSYFLN